MTPDRSDPALQGGDGAVTAAHAEREARLTADIAAMQAGPTEHAAGLTDHHQGFAERSGTDADSHASTQNAGHGRAPVSLRPDLLAVSACLQVPGDFRRERRAVVQADPPVAAGQALDSPAD